MPHSDLLTLIGQMACNDDASTQDICGSILFLIAGFDSAQLDQVCFKNSMLKNKFKVVLKFQTLIPVYTTNTPAGASTKQFVHYAHGINSGKISSYKRNKHDI